MFLRTTFALVLAALVAGCGTSEEQPSRQRGGVGAEVCDLPALSPEPALPANFPKPEQVTYRRASEAGPSQIVDGTFAGDIDEAYDAYERAVGVAGYNVLFKEQEENDAEISYEGGGTTGQIALRAVCGDENKLVVHITNRPGS